MGTVLLLGGFHPGQSLWSIQKGFEGIGWDVVYQPTRGCVRAHLDADRAMAREEADLIADASEWALPYEDVEAFQDGVFRLVEERKPKILIWWFSKDDCPPGFIRALREKFPGCKTVTHTQDDPWDLLRSPHFTQDFEFAATCCKESVEVYESRGIKPIVLYPPPALELHKIAESVPHEQCDFSLTILSLYAREGGSEEEYLKSSDPETAVTHVIPFPEQRALRHEVVSAVKDLGRIHIYGGLGFGTFEGISRPSYRGFRTYAELPGVYASAKININQHNSPLSNGYLNQRDTAITGSGGFMLTDYVNGIEEIFDIGEEIDTWETLEELKDKAAWWLRHDDERQAAARRAQERILRDYGNEAYARKLVQFVGAAS
jgi:hypothetical protein